MSGPNVVIIILENAERSPKTKKTTLVLAVEAGAMALATKELADMRTKVNKDEIIFTNCTKSTSFQPGHDIVKFQVHTKDPTNRSKKRKNITYQRTN